MKSIRSAAYKRVTKQLKHSCSDDHWIVCASWTITHTVTHSAQGVTFNSTLLAGFTPQWLACLGIATLAAVAAATPHMHMHTPSRHQQCIDDLDNTKFRGSYCFR